MVIKHIITKDKEGQYYTIPFDVPENVTKITVTYDYYKPTKGLMGDLKPSTSVLRTKRAISSAGQAVLIKAYMSENMIPPRGTFAKGSTRVAGILSSVLIM